MRLFIIIILIIGLLANTSAFAQGMREQAYRPMGEEIRKEKPSPEVPLGVPEGLKKEEEKVVTPSMIPIMEIKGLGGEKPLYSFELRDVEIGDLFRVLAYDYKLNLLIDNDVKGKITASLTNVSLEEALEAIAESQNLTLEKKGNIIKVSPNLITQTFTLKYIEAKKLLEPSGAEAAQVGAAEAMTKEAAGAQAMPSAVGAQATTAKQANTIYDLLSEKGRVLLGKQPNSIMVIDYPPNIKKIEEYLKAIDQKMTQRVFKLKYLKAAEVVGIAVTAPAPAGEAVTPTGTTTEGTTGGAGGV